MSKFVQIAIVSACRFVLALAIKRTRTRGSPGTRDVNLRAALKFDVDSEER